MGSVLFGPRATSVNRVRPDQRNDPKRLPEANPLVRVARVHDITPNRCVLSVGGAQLVFRDADILRAVMCHERRNLYKN